jgi:hypothetical protein
MKQIAFLAVIMLPAGLHRYAIAQVPAASRPAREDQVRAFLTSYVESEGMRASETRYADAFIDLNGDGVEEVIVYLAGQDWCGTGGCTTLVLMRAGDSYVLVGRIPATRPPIRVLRERTHGWRTLTAWISGATFKAYETKYPFDGKRYSIGGRRIVGTAEGDLVIPGGDVRNEKPLSVGLGPIR